MLNPVFRLLTPPTLGLQAIAFSLHSLDNRHYGSALKGRLSELLEQFDLNASRQRMQGFEQLRQRLGRSARRFPASPQALLESHLRNGALRSISPIVDLYNQWSLNSGLSIGAHDLQRLQLPVSLTLARGGEPFQALGSESHCSLPAGEYAYLDASGQVLCRMEYRQCAATALQPESSAALFIVQGHAQTDPAYLSQCAEALKNDLLRCCTGSIHRVA